jgi:prepilin peptidase CpaA
MLSYIAYLFPFLMIFAICMDLFTMQISNKLTMGIAVGFLPVALLSGLPLLSLELESIALHFACGFSVLMMSFILFTMGKIGGGDAKLMAASAIWIGWAQLLDYLVIACLLGGVFAILLLAARAFPLPLVMLKQPWIARLHTPKGPLPFGVALGIGAIAVYSRTPVWLGAMGS